MRDFRLYIILDADVCADYEGLIETAAALIASGYCDVLQLRAKGQSTSEIVQTARKIKGLIKANSPLFVINDCVDAAAAVNADGVHLGQDDLPVKTARRILGKDKIIGLSTHNLRQAEEAEQRGADYIGIGPIFTTATKPELTAISPDIITQLKDRIRIPFTAIGGINLKNVQEVIRCGASRVAVCRAILGADDPVCAAGQFRRILMQA